MSQQVADGARVRAAIDVGGVIRPYVAAGTAGRVVAVVDGGYVVRFDAAPRAMGVHPDELVVDAAVD